MSKIDPAHKNADAELKAMERKIRKEYRKAAEEVEDKLNDYLRRFYIKDKKWREWVKNGKKTRAEYKQWRIGQIAVGKRWEAVRDSLTEVYINADKAAYNIINEKIPRIFADNINYATFQIEKGLFIDTSFVLYDEQTVARLLKDNPDMLPPPGQKTSQAIREGKAVRWNNQHIQSVMIQSIIQGKAITDIAYHLAQTVGDSDSKAAIRNARTMTTAAENAGRVAGYYRAQSMGIKLKKQWMATLDGRTRHSHRLLDGETAKIENRFSNGLRYPGDPNGAPAEIYNCFIGKTKVASDSKIIRSYKHQYNGELISIKSAGGVNFTCTPNHPILTLRGWVSAGKLHKGDYLVVTFVGNGKRSRGNPDINHGFSRFDTFHKFFKRFGCKRTCSLGVNFHGDIPTSNVEVVRKKRLLENYRDTSKLKEKSKLSFIHSNKAFMRKRTFMKHFGSIWKSTFGFISCKCKAFSLIWRSLSHAKKHGFRPIALLDSGRVKPIKNDVSRDVKFLSESLDGFSGVVFADKVIDINVDSGCTHVYNLQTENGYYFVDNTITDGEQMFNGMAAIAHNCRCTLIASLEGFENDLTDLSLRNTNKMEGMTYNEWKQAKAKSDPIDKQEQIAKEMKAYYIWQYRYL